MVFNQPTKYNAVLCPNLPSFASAQPRWLSGTKGYVDRHMRPTRQPARDPPQQVREVAKERARFGLVEPMRGTPSSVLVRSSVVGFNAARVAPLL